MARSEAKLKHLLFSLEGNFNSYLAVDLSDHIALKEKLNELVEKGVKVSILVCNAGGPKAGPLASAGIDEFKKGIDTHLIANQILVQSVLPAMMEQGFGRIINIISTSVKAPIPNLGVSNTVRGAVASWAKTLASELGPFGITVNNVLPGFTATERLEVLKKATADRLGKSISEVEELWKKSIPAGRFADAGEIASAVSFLASPAAAYINGINLPVDGGRTMSL